MARIFRIQLSGNDAARSRRSSDFFIEFTDHTGEPRIVRYGKGRQCAEAAGRMIDRLVSIRKANDHPELDMIAWFKDCPLPVHVSLIRYGIITQSRTDAAKSLATHIADWRNVLLNVGYSGKEVDQRIAEVSGVFGEGGVRHWDDISYPDIRRIVCGKTIFKYTRDRHRCIDSVMQFCQWMRETDRAFNRPLRGLDLERTKTSRTMADGHSRLRISPA